MQNFTTTTGLKNEIQLLETRKAENVQQLKEQFQLTYRSFKPVNLLKNAVKNITSSPILVDNILGTSIGLVTGYISKKIVVGTSGNIFRKLFGSVLQYGVTNIVSKHPEAIKSFGRFIVKNIPHKKEINSNEQGDS